MVVVINKVNQEYLLCDNYPVRLTAIRQALSSWLQISFPLNSVPKLPKGFPLWLLPVTPNYLSMILFGTTAYNAVFAVPICVVVMISLAKVMNIVVTGLCTYELNPRWPFKANSFHYTHEPAWLLQWFPNLFLRIICRLSFVNDLRGVKLRGKYWYEKVFLFWRREI